MKCLIVEDEFSSRMLLQAILARIGECHVVVNGTEAVAAFCLEGDSHEEYDLICMDIEMPEMDGQEALRRIRAVEASAGIISSEGVKVIMLTAADDPKSVITAYQGLCGAYLTKPIDKGKLLDRVKEFHLI